MQLTKLVDGTPCRVPAGLLVVFLLFSGAAQAQNLLWAVRAGGGVGGESGNGIVLDAAGNVFVTGNYHNGATFGPGDPNQTVLAESGGPGAFVAKYGANGVLAWVAQATGPGSAEGLAIALDGAGNIYITGDFDNQLTFMSVDAEGPTVEINSVGNGRDIFVASYDPSGNVRWAERAGSAASSDEGRGIGVDGSSNVYVTGVIISTEMDPAFFGSLMPGLVSFGNQDIFLAQYDTNGNAQWAVHAGGAGADEGHGVAVDETGNSHLTGFFTGDATFGATMLMTDSNSPDGFVAKYDNGGTLTWVTQIEGSGDARGQGIALDGSGASYLTGFFTGRAIFDLVSADFTANARDIFTAKYDLNGSFVWARRSTGTTNSEEGKGIALDAGDNVYVTGIFRGSVSFDGSVPITSVNAFDDVFLLMYDGTGTIQWVRKDGGDGIDSGNGVVVGGPDNRSYVTGAFPNAAIFGRWEPNVTRLKAPSASGDIFLAAYADDSADITTLGDINADTVPDLARLVDVPGAAPLVEFFSGANGMALSQLSYLNRFWTGLAIDALADGNQDGTADDPAVALLAVNPNTGTILVQARLSDGTVVVEKITFFNTFWTPLDVIVINDTNGDGNADDASVGVLALNAAIGTIAVQVRPLSNPNMAATRFFLNSAWTPVAADVVLRAGLTPLIGVLGVNKSTSRLVVQSRRLSDGVWHGNTYPLNAAWTGVDLASLEDGNSDGTADDPAWLILATNPTSDNNVVRSQRVVSGTSRSSWDDVFVFNTLWNGHRVARSPDISGNNIEELHVLAYNRRTNTWAVQIVDYDLEAEIDTIFP